MAKWLFLTLSPGKVQSILSNCMLFFILGMGRSGTTFLANLLDAAPASSVYHETPEDFKALVEAYWNPAKANEYLAKTRSRIIAARILHSKCKVYGEVNGLLRYHVDALRHYENAIILHLVRDGRLVVRSIMGRRAFTSADKHHTGRIAPLKGDPYQERWPTMSRFEKVCWYWASTAQFLQSRQLPLIRFEDVIGSYEQFKYQLLDPLKIVVPCERWLAVKNQPRNVGDQNTFPAWQDWTYAQQNQFREICGDSMRSLEYEI